MVYLISVSWFCAHCMGKIYVRFVQRTRNKNFKFNIFLGLLFILFKGIVSVDIFIWPLLNVPLQILKEKLLFLQLVLIQSTLREGQKFVRVYEMNVVVRFCLERMLLSLYFWRKKKMYGVLHVGIHGGIIEATEYMKKF